MYSSAPLAVHRGRATLKGGYPPFGRRMMRLPTRTARVRKLAIAAIGAAGMVAAFIVASPAEAVPSGGLMINEVYGGGGNSGSTYTNDFVELANRSSQPIGLSGYSVQYH